jgi:hypothetical protein
MIALRDVALTGETWGAFYAETPSLGHSQMTGGTDAEFAFALPSVAFARQSFRKS